MNNIAQDTASFIKKINVAPPLCSYFPTNIGSQYRKPFPVPNLFLNS